MYYGHSVTWNIHVISFVDIKLPILVMAQNTGKFVALIAEVFLTSNYGGLFP